MEIRDRIAEEFDKRKEGFLIFALLLGAGFFINRGVELKGLYMDDLYLWSCYGEQSFFEFVFPMGSTRFRFVFYLAAWLELLLLGHHVGWMVPFNIILNVCIAFSLYKIAFHMNRRKLVSLAVGLAYLVSRLAYYQISQFYGLMESLGLWAAVGLLYYAYRYVNERNTGSYLLANLCYFLASFIHERYMALVPVLFLALLMGKRSTGRDYEAGTWEERKQEERTRRSRKRRERETGGILKLLLSLITTGLFGLILLIRFVTIGTLSPAGTGGTDVADTFQFGDALGHALEQVGMVFGRNTGPEYLCMLAFEDSPEHIQRYVLFSNLVLAVCVAVFLFAVLRSGRQMVGYLKNLALFLVFIALCIGSSSVTIRVELRWVYVVYAAALLVLAYMSSVMGKAGLLVFLYVGSLIPAETFYRGCWENLYYWPNQLRYNSLAEVTAGTYDNDIFKKQVYIIGNTYEMSEFTAETFLKVYDKDKKGENTKIEFIDSDFDFKTITDEMVILCEDVENNAYLDVTSFVEKQRFNRAYGSYEDGWVDKQAKIVFLNGDTDTVTLNCYYPGKITGKQVCTVKVNGKKLPDLVFTDSAMSYEFPAAPYQMISLELSCNFYVTDAKEKRGEESLAMIVDIKADK
jgi:hypothetical protein